MSVQVSPALVRLANDAIQHGVLSQDSPTVGAQASQVPWCPDYGRGRVHSSRALTNSHVRPGQIETPNSSRFARAYACDGPANQQRDARMVASVV
jgi:hypothetical protein